MRVARVLALGLALLPAATTDPLAGRIAGAPVDCIDLARQGGPEIVDDHTILYRESGRRTWLARPIGTCPSLRPLQTLIVEVYGGRVCRLDRFRVLTPGMTIPSAYCAFDRFTPYDKPARGK